MTKVCKGIVLDEFISFSLQEICRICDVSAEGIIEMIEEGVVFPKGDNPAEWIFHGTDVKKIQIALRLQQDLRVNLPGAALALDLLEQIKRMQDKKNVERILSTLLNTGGMNG